MLGIAGLAIISGSTALAATPDYPEASRADCDSAASTRVLRPVTSPGTVRDAQAWWLDRRTVLWPGAPDRGRITDFRRTDLHRAEADCRNRYAC